MAFSAEEVSRASLTAYVDLNNHAMKLTSCGRFCKRKRRQRQINYYFYFTSNFIYDVLFPTVVHSEMQCQVPNYSYPTGLEICIKLWIFINKMSNIILKVTC